MISAGPSKSQWRRLHDKDGFKGKKRPILAVQLACFRRCQTHFLQARKGSLLRRKSCFDFDMGLQQIARIPAGAAPDYVSRI